MKELSNEKNVPAIAGENTAGGIAVLGTSENCRGVVGRSTNDHAISGESVINGGVLGESVKSSGVIGQSKEWYGVYGNGPIAGGVCGDSEKGAGVIGSSKKWLGVYGNGPIAGGVRGDSEKGAGVIGNSKEWLGVYGEALSPTGGAGVWGEHKANGIGTCGKSAGGVGVWGETTSVEAAAVRAENKGNGVGIFAKGGRLAALLDGDVEVTGDIRLVNADCAEDFDVGSEVSVQPGTVMVLSENGCVVPSTKQYDKRVVGVISGAGKYKPGIVLDKPASAGIRQPIGLLGKLYCKVDASFGAIQIGDLLTTSPTQGHAMKAEDHVRAFGAVIGKALQPHCRGQGLIAILISGQ
jgi:hypothetical protein